MKIALLLKTKQEQRLLVKKKQRRRTAEIKRMTLTGAALGREAARCAASIFFHKTMLQ